MSTIPVYHSGYYLSGSYDGEEIGQIETLEPLAGAWEKAPANATVPARVQRWSEAFVIAPNDRNFPTAKLTTGPNLPEKDLEALLTGIYGSSPGCLCTYDNEVVEGMRIAQISPTIARPDRGYSGTYNYFDPDNFISLSAMIYSGDEYLQRQARDVLMRSGDFLKVTLLATSATTVKVNAADSDRSELVSTLRKMSRTYGSFQLMQIANKAASDPFGKVRGLINDMLAKLEKQAQEEATQKAFCDEETKESHAKKSDSREEAESTETKPVQ